jgi:hypothetical protein
MYPSPEYEESMFINKQENDSAASAKNLGNVNVNVPIMSTKSSPTMSMPTQSPTSASAAFGGGSTFSSSTSIPQRSPVMQMSVPSSTTSTQIRNRTPSFLMNKTATLMPGKSGMDFRSKPNTILPQDLARKPPMMKPGMMNATTTSTVSTNADTPSGLLGSSSGTPGSAGGYSTATSTPMNVDYAKVGLRNANKSEGE